MDDIEFWNQFEVRAGRDGKQGIYLRKFNVRLATFNENTKDLQNKLSELFDTGLVTPVMKKATGRAIPLFQTISARSRKFRAPPRS